VCSGPGTLALTMRVYPHIMHSFYEHNYECLPSANLLALCGRSPHDPLHPHGHRDTLTTDGKLSAESYAALWKLHGAGLVVIP